MDVSKLNSIRKIYELSTPVGSAELERRDIVVHPVIYSNKTHVYVKTPGSDTLTLISVRDIHDSVDKLLCDMEQNASNNWGEFRILQPLYFTESPELYASRFKRLVLKRRIERQETMVKARERDLERIKNTLEESRRLYRQVIERQEESL